MKYSKGEKVLAKWPGSSTYYKGVIIDVRNKECKVQFEEGSEYVVDVKNVKADDDKTSQPKSSTLNKNQLDDDTPLLIRSEGRMLRNPSASKASPVKKRTASPSRKSGVSPGRKPGTSPSRKRDASPGRKPRTSPARKAASPSRKSTRQSLKETTPEHSFLGQINDKILKVVLDQDLRKSIERANSAIRSSVERANSAVRSFSDLSFSSADKTSDSSAARASVSNITLRKSTRILTLKENELRRESSPTLLQRMRESTPVSSVKSTVLENVSEFRDKPYEPTPKKYREFGGWLGALFWLLFVPPTIVTLHLYARHLYGAAPVLKAARDWKTFVDLKWGVLGLGFVVFQALLALLPIGRVVEGLPDKQGRLRYRCNGFWNCLLTLVIVGALHYLDYPVTEALDKLVPLLVTGLLLGFLVSVLLFIKGGRAPVVALNPHGNSGIRTYDFFMGREINPRVGPWDVKMTLLNVAVISLMVINVLVVIKGLQTGRVQSPTLMLAVGMQLFYYADYLWHGSSLLSSFEIMYEGMGAMAALGYAVFSFFPPLITLHIFHEKVELHPITLVVLCLIHTVGYVVYRASNNQKNEFRKNPLNPSLNHLEAIVTSRGRKLLVSGWWGWVRHPNYLGDLLIIWTWGCTAGSSHWLPYVVPLTTTFFILHRMLRNEARCHQRYNSAWELYCRRVPGRLLPKVF